MDRLLQPRHVACPYCGETIELLIDCSLEEQRYIEDCAVCCRPITVHAMVAEDGLAFVEVHHEDEA